MGSLTLFIVFLETCGSTVVADPRPNILILLVDDLGIGDVGCFGNDTIRTPNIDRLSKEGVKLTQHISAAPLCSPSRAAFLTGRYPIRSGMASNHLLGHYRVISGLGVPGGLPRNESTFASILKKKGYKTGLIGKWHQGLNCKSRDDHCHHPFHYGFDYYYGMPYTLISPCWPDPSRKTELGINNKLWICTQLLGVMVFTLILGKVSGWVSVPWSLIVAIAMFGVLLAYSWLLSYSSDFYWNCILMRAHEITEQPMKAERAGTIMVKEGISFIQRNRHGPFLLFFSFLHVHIPLPTTDKFIGTSKHGLYRDNVQEMDFMVGGKGMGGWEGGIRVPGIIRWPEVLQAGKVIHEPTSLMDIYPTLILLGGAALPRDRVIDGRDLMPLLKGDVQHSDHEFLFHYCGVYLHAVRWHQKDSGTIWKVHYVTPIFNPKGAQACYESQFCTCTGKNVTHHDPPLLFDLSRDPSEATPLSRDTEPLYDLVITKVGEALRQHRQTITPVPQQLSDYNNNSLWMEPCCGVFPFCLCDREGGNEELNS
ncbi:arylsulfatase F-like [Choloepus didactylus]|uniref:arylsulfatase F-like n=1 Tax=Choloepus didactylus TaxID=27675 RepID=UPI00189F69C4|nr:arylsulfatase F-like [Choloepus didactylus]